LGHWRCEYFLDLILLHREDIVFLLIKWGNLFRYALSIRCSPGRTWEGCAFTTHIWTGLLRYAHDCGGCLVYSVLVWRKFSDFAHCMVHGWGNSALFIWSSNCLLEDGGNCTEMRLGGVRLQNKNERGWGNWPREPRIRQKVDFDRPCSTKSRVKCPLILPPPLV